MDDATTREPGPERWRAQAPEAFELFDHVEALAAGSVDDSILAPVRAAVAAQLCHPDELTRPVTGAADAPADRPADPRADVCVSFAEQFVVDVAGITDEQRAALGGVMGSDTFVFTQALYVIDVFQRGRITLARLFDTPFGPALPAASGDLWGTLERFMRVVALGVALDPLTTELVRLRGARAHQCRVCQSRLSVRALDSAGSEEPFAAIDDYEHGDLSERHRVALRLTDALITQPAFIDDQLVAQVWEQFTAAEVAEIVLDVVRNGANKIAVALGGDEAQVADGIEFFDVDASGDVVAGTDIDEVRALSSAR